MGTEQASDYIRGIYTLHSPMFLLNSRHSHFFATKKLAILKPKIRMYFAEFLLVDLLISVVFSTSSPVSDCATVFL